MKPGRITKIDKSGKAFEVGAGSVDDFFSLLEMYRTFSPRPASQGLPPEDPETCQNWVKTLFEIGGNFFAWRGDRVIGHAALVPDLKGKSAEFIVFVDQNQRNLGIGTELTRFILERSRQLGLDSVWLTVNLSNSIAIRLYRNLGFEYTDQESMERLMRIKLSSVAATET